MYRFFFILIVLTCLSCSKPVSEGEVFGIYIITDGEGQGNTLTIKSDLTYVHQFEPNALGVDMYSGKWELEIENGGDLRIILNNFNFASIRNDWSRPIGMWGALVQKRMGNVIICFDLDISSSRGCFTKVE